MNLIYSRPPQASAPLVSNNHGNRKNMYPNIEQTAVGLIWLRSDSLTPDSSILVMNIHGVAWLPFETSLLCVYMWFIVAMMHISYTIGLLSRQFLHLSVKGIALCPWTIFIQITDTEEQICANYLCCCPAKCFHFYHRSTKWCCTLKICFTF